MAPLNPPSFPPKPSPQTADSAHILHHCPDDLAQDGSVDIHGNRVSRAHTGGWKACAFIIVVELSERLAYYGIQANLTTYLTEVLHQDSVTSTKNVSNWAGVTNILPWLGAFVADTFWGRFWTIAALSIVYVLGLVSLTLSVSIKSLRPSACTSKSSCPKANSAQLGVFFFSLYLVSLGTGGVKPCLQAFGADQFDEEDPRERRRKSSFFNAWNFGLCTGTFIAFAALVNIQEKVSWGIGYGIPTGAMGISFFIFLAGMRFYRHKRPGGSPFTQVAQVFVAAIHKWNVKTPSDPKLLHENTAYDEESVRIGRRQLEHTDRLLFLDKAAAKENDGDGANLIKPSPWRLCTVTQVEEVKLVLRIVPVSLTTFVYGLVTIQIFTWFTKQGKTLDRRLGGFTVPAASLQAILPLVVLAALPAYDRLLVPAARRLTGNERGLSLLQRVGTGLLLTVVALVIAASVETRRLRVAARHGLLDNTLVPVPMSICWLLPQYALFGVVDVFATVGLQEFFYDQMPDTLRSLGMAFYLCAFGVGSFLNTIIITLVDKVTTHDGRHHGWFQNNLNRAHIDYYYWLLAIVSTINLGAFMLIAYFYQYKKAIPTSTLGLSSPRRFSDYDPTLATNGLALQKLSTIKLYDA